MKLNKAMIPALVLCMSAFLMPMTAHAQSAADTTPPTVAAKLSGDTLHIEASDDGSGVDAVLIDGKRINYRVDSAVDVALKDYAGTGQTVSIYAVDFAGNKCDPVQVKNPYYKAPAATTTPKQEKPAATEKPSASASADPEQTADTKPFTPDGQATVTDNATDEDGKEFYTFTTPNDNVFYLVVDKQRDSDNVYFLNAVTEDDLAALAAQADDQGKDGESAIPEVCACVEKCAPGEVDTACPVCLKDLTGCTAKAAAPEADPNQEPEPPKKESNNGTLIFVLLAVAAAGGAGYYFKVYKPKKELDDAEDFDEILADDEEQTVNEDADAEQGAADTAQDGGAEPVYDDYPDDDFPDEPDDEPKE